MFIPRIYYPHPLVIDDLVVLDKEHSHYLITVLRLQHSDPVILFNGEGGEFYAECQLLKKVVQLRITAFNSAERQSPLFLHLGQALVRGDRMDLVIQKATELGVNHITPLITMNSTVKLDAAKLANRLEHWKKIAISASEQCGRTDIPQIDAPLALNKWILQSFNGLSLVFEPQGSCVLKELPFTTHVRFAIGPESGWQEKEMDQIIAQGFSACTLGPRILRTETAALVVASVLQSQFGDL